MIYNAVLISSVQQSESYTHTHTHTYIHAYTPSFKILFPYRSIQSIE